MKVLHVIHGYPARYNAGSEIYTQTLARAQSAHHELHVFTREEDSFAPEHRLRQEHDGAVTLHIVNVPHGRDRYRYVEVDQRFAEVLDVVRPAIVHVGHLNHLATSLLMEVATTSWWRSHAKPKPFGVALTLTPDALSLAPSASPTFFGVLAGRSVAARASASRLSCRPARTVRTRRDLAAVNRPRLCLPPEVVCLVVS